MGFCNGFYFKQSFFDEGWYNDICGYKDRYYKCSQELYRFKNVAIVGSPHRSLTAPAAGSEARVAMAGMLSFLPVELTFSPSV